MKTLHDDSAGLQSERDMKIEMAAVLVGVAIFVGMLFFDAYTLSVLWLMAALFAFGIWRIGKAQFD